MVYSQEIVDFGKRFAVLNLDWMTVLVGPVKDTDEGKAFISNCSRWNQALHKKSPRPLTVYTKLCFSSMHPELKNDSPFSKLTEPIGTFEIGTPEAQLASFFQIDAQDTVVDKTRFSGTTGSSLEQIIKAQNIDTVVISGVTLSGAVMSTVYHLLDLDYNIFVITDSVVELPTSHNTEFIKVMMDTLPKMSLKTISLDQALVALEKS